MRFETSIYFSRRFCCVGLKQFDIDQAVFLAKLGYVGLACDLYKYPIAERNPDKTSSRDERVSHFANAFSEMNGLLKVYILQWCLALPTFESRGKILMATCGTISCPFVPCAGPTVFPQVHGHLP